MLFLDWPVPLERIAAERLIAGVNENAWSIDFSAALPRTPVGSPPTAGSLVDL
jgi:hypothetical protein